MMANGVKKALEANRAAYDALRDRLHAGLTEKDAWKIVAEAVDAVCGDEPHEFIGDFIGGARTGAIEGSPTDLVLKAGDLFLCDLSVRRGDVWSDTCRTFFLGEPTPAQRQAYAAVLACQELGERIVRAGVVCEDVKTQVEAFLVSRNYGGKMPHHVGHLVGPEPYRKPAFEMGEKSVLEDGSVCTLEPGLYFEGDFGIRVENDYFVAQDGLVNLFDYPREMEYFIV